MSSYVVKKTSGDTEWFMHDRFGLFIHWGTYAAHSRGVWHRNSSCETNEEYERYMNYFTADMFDPKEWARTAKETGMKYVVITTKHHEGFCLWDTAYTDYKAPNSAAGRDLLREFVDAFRAEGIKIGFYYSLIDWHHKDFLIDSIHPLRYHENAGEMNKTRDMERYVEYMKNQIRELLTNYGKIDIMWYDFSYYKPNRDITKPATIGFGKEDWHTEELVKLTRELQPGIIINNRADMDQDIWTPEQFQPQDWIKDKKTGELVPWEVCQTFSGSWGYNRDEMTWKTPEMLIRMLIKTVATGGNLLLNVGPTARGFFDNRAKHALSGIGEWMKYNSRSIYGCTMAEPEFKAPNGCYYTQSLDGKRLYVHIFDYPMARLDLPGLADKVEYAQFVNDNSMLTFKNAEYNIEYEGVNPGDNDTETTGHLFINLPITKPDFDVPVIELFLK